MAQRKEFENNITTSLINDLIIDPMKLDFLNDDFLRCMRPVEPRSKLNILVPKFHPKEKKLPKYFSHKPKEPKFIPYEPYKAAVMPLHDRFKEKFVQKRICRNNFEIQKLAEQVSEMRRTEMNEINRMMEENGNALKLKWKKEKEAYEIDIKNLRESNSHLENQLKFQAQVNSELKTLLVAAVGEDLESRVQHLTEDKLSLARALLNSANHLNSHQEQTEWLLGQCEVWRSKFLASSVMVEELAKWKSALTKALNDLQEVTKTLLDERRKIHSQSLKLYCYLRAILEHASNDPTPTSLKYRNILEVMAVNLELAATLKKTIDVPDNLINEIYKENKTIQPSFVEKKVEKMLQNPVAISNIQDALCSAVMGAATGQQVHLPFSNFHCCAHCKGEVHNI